MPGFYGIEMKIIICRPREEQGNKMGAVTNQCIHNIDLCMDAWGEVEQVNAMLGNFTHPYIEMEDYGSIQIRFKMEL